MNATLDYLYYGARMKAPHHKFSNFYWTSIRLTRDDVDPAFLELQPTLKEWLGDDGLTFPSSEHLWQAIDKAADKITFMRFTSSGDFGKWQSDIFARTVLAVKARMNGFQSVAAAAQTKLKGWMKKGSIGIIAKLAANPDYAKSLGLVGKMYYEREFLPADQERKVWLAILSLKFRQSDELKQQLVQTRNLRLVEFDRGATNHTRKKSVHWGGQIVEGRLVGNNVMGKYLADVRNNLLGANAS